MVMSWPGAARRKTLCPRWPIPVAGDRGGRGRPLTWLASRPIGASCTTCDSGQGNGSRRGHSPIAATIRKPADNAGRPGARRDHRRRQPCGQIGKFCCTNSTAWRHVAAAPVSPRPAAWRCGDRRARCTSSAEVNAREGSGSARRPTRCGEPGCRASSPRRSAAGCRGR
jgi:hypothetical protein